MTDTCIRGCDLRGKPIPVEYLEKGYYGEWDGVTPMFYSRLIGIELPYDDPKHYDGVSEWLCPDCGVRWDRFTKEVLDAGQRP